MYCTDPKLLPVVKKCDILEQYCQFIEIVEQNYNRLFPRRSFKIAIELAMEQGILADYLDRKSREVINMLCAKYDYKMDIAVKQEEAREDGIAIGIKQATEEAVRKFYENGVSIQVIAKSLNISAEQVQEILKS